MARPPFPSLPTLKCCRPTSSTPCPQPRGARRPSFPPEPATFRKPRAASPAGRREAAEDQQAPRGARRHLGACVRHGVMGAAVPGRRPRVLAAALALPHGGLQAGTGTGHHARAAGRGAAGHEGQYLVMRSPSTRGPCPLSHLSHAGLSCSQTVGSHVSDTSKMLRTYFSRQTY